MRTDIDPDLKIPMGLDTLRRQPRRTSFGIDQVEVHTCEHLLSVLHVLGIENLICEIDGPEIPGMDGSALPFLEAIGEAGRLRSDMATLRESDSREPLLARIDGRFRATDYRYEQNPTHPIHADSCRNSFGPGIGRKYITPTRGESR